MFVKPSLYHISSNLGQIGSAMYVVLFLFTLSLLTFLGLLTRAIHYLILLVVTQCCSFTTKNSTMNYSITKMLEERTCGGGNGVGVGVIYVYLV